jgi:ABC-type dipeptide/oligopeptide/nickel transport system permease subunit
MLQTSSVQTQNPVKSRGLFTEHWKQFKRNKGALFGGVLALVMVLMAIFAPLIAPFDPIGFADLSNYLKPPGWKIAPSSELPHGGIFWLGSDNQGRDVLSRIIYGARISLSVGLVVQAISLTIGTLLGLLAGYYGKWIDDLITWLTNIMFAFPNLLFALAIMVVIGPGLYNVFFALGFVGWPTVCRLVRAEVLSLKEREFVEATRAAGSPDPRILFRHVLPNCLGPVIVVGTLGVAGAILSEATLSFLGVGTQPPAPSWGSMLSQGKDFMRTAYWLTLFPGLAIFLTILGLNLLGDGLRDALDPRLKE